MKQVTLFVDGSCLGNPGFGGWACLLRYGPTVREISGSEANTTNNRMELRAVIEGFAELKEPCAPRVVTDSQYVQRGMTRTYTRGARIRGETLAGKGSRTRTSGSDWSARVIAMRLVGVGFAATAPVLSKIGATNWPTLRRGNSPAPLESFLIYAVANWHSARPSPSAVIPNHQPGCHAIAARADACLPVTERRGEFHERK